MAKNNVEITRSSKVSVPLGVVLAGILAIVGFFQTQQNRVVKETSKQVRQLVNRMDLAFYMFSEAKKKIDLHYQNDKILNDEDVRKALP